MIEREESQQARQDVVQAWLQQHRPGWVINDAPTSPKFYARSSAVVEELRRLAQCHEPAAAIGIYVNRQQPLQLRPYRYFAVAHASVPGIDGPVEIRRAESPHHTVILDLLHVASHQRLLERERASQEQQAALRGGSSSISEYVVQVAERTARDYSTIISRAAVAADRLSAPELAPWDVGFAYERELRHLTRSLDAVARQAEALGTRARELGLTCPRFTTLQRSTDGRTRALGPETTGIVRGRVEEAKHLSPSEREMLRLAQTFLKAGDALRSCERQIVALELAPLRVSIAKEEEFRWSMLSREAGGRPPAEAALSHVARELKEATGALKALDAELLGSSDQDVQCMRDQLAVDHRIIGQRFEELRRGEIADGSTKRLRTSVVELRRHTLDTLETFRSGRCVERGPTNEERIWFEELTRIPTVGDQNQRRAQSAIMPSLSPRRPVVAVGGSALQKVSQQDRSGMSPQNVGWSMLLHQECEQVRKHARELAGRLDLRVKAGQAPTSSSRGTNSPGSRMTWRRERASEDRGGGGARSHIELRRDRLRQYCDLSDSQAQARVVKIATARLLIRRPELADLYREMQRRSRSGIER